MSRSSARLDRHHTLQATEFADDLVLVRGALDIALLAVERLVLAGFTREQDQAGFVGGEACDVEGEGFFGGRAAAGVDGDADCGSEFAGDAGFLCELSVGGLVSLLFW